MRWVSLSLVLLSGCLRAAGNVQVSRGDLEPSVSAAIDRIEVVVLSGSGEREGQVVPLLCSELLRGTTELDPAGEGVLYSESSLINDVTLPPVGRIDDGRVLFAARARDEECAVIAMGCTTIEVARGSGRNVVVRLQALESPRSCPSEMACVDGDCRPCEDDEDCQNDDPCFFATCNGARCLRVPASPDLDADGFLDIRCGGEDCDDTDDSILPGAARRCGRALDHDCDGAVDDAQGCETGDLVTGLTLVNSLDLPAQRLFVLGSGSDDGAGTGELFAAGSGFIDVFEVAPDHEASPLATTSTDSLEPTTISLVGDHAFLTDGGQSGVTVYSADALRAGDAEPVMRVGTTLGTISAIFSSTSMLYLASETGALATASLIDLPTIPEPEVVADGLPFFDSLRRSGPWLFASGAERIGVVEVASRGELVADSTRAYTVRGSEISDLEALPEWVVLARGNLGLQLVDRSELITADGCCDTLHEIGLPDGCGSIRCAVTRRVALVGSTRAVVATYQAVGAQYGRIYLVDVSTPSSMTQLGEWDLSHPTADVEDLVVSGPLVVVATKVPNEAEGAVDFFVLE